MKSLLLLCHFTAQVWEECTSSIAKEEIPAYNHTNNCAVHIHKEVDSTLSLFLCYSLTEGSSSKTKFVLSNMLNVPVIQQGCLFVPESKDHFQNEFFKCQIDWVWMFAQSKLSVKPVQPSHLGACVNHGHAPVSPAPGDSAWAGWSPEVPSSPKDWLWQPERCQMFFQLD